ncbi:MAG TPA: hypothetical protein VGN85_06855 [Methyloceanibacter sp.]|nr:hypothetical protein [Methyloceanibacter sp.]
MRDARHCEIIPIVRDRLHLEATVYNTLGLNDCPASVWDSITEEAMKQRFGAITVLLNGPRYFLMDSITAEGATKAGEKIDAGGLALTERASIDVGLFDLLDRAYRETTIDRDTTYLFKAGSPIFMLEAPDGARYVMQAYAQIVDKTLTYNDLPALAAPLHDDGRGKGSRRRRDRKGDRRAGRSQEYLSEARLKLSHKRRIAP